MVADPHTMLQLVKLLPDGSKALDSLRDIRIPAMDMPINARNIIQSALHPNCLMSRPYGATETGTVSGMLYNQRDLNDPNGVGFTFPGVQVRLVDENGSEVTDYDTPAEIEVKTLGLFSDYYGNPAATANAFRDGWFVTGDVGYISSTTKQWTIIGRKKYIFKVAGKYVAPEEIESLLVSHKNIVDAAITPFNDKSSIDLLIKAFVVLKAPNALTEADITSFVESRLAPEKKITGGVHFVTSIPRNGLHKIIRWKLYEMIRKDVNLGIILDGNTVHELSPTASKTESIMAESNHRHLLNGKELKPNRAFGSIFAFPVSIITVPKAPSRLKWLISLGLSAPHRAPGSFCEKQPKYREHRN